MAKCSNENCTVALTGKCVLELPLDKCSYLLKSQDEKTEDDDDDGLELEEKEEEIEDAAPPVATEKRFYSCSEFGLDTIGSITNERYAKVIGILGKSETGKTCFLVSLYLHAINKLLKPQYSFAGSYSLRAFEDRSKRVRKWGTTPPQGILTEHTRLKDARNAGFLHLRLLAEDTTFHDLLLTDLPGEWSETAINNVRYVSRIEFMKRADCIVLSLDGEMLNGDERHLEAQHAVQLVQRLVHNAGVKTSTPIVVLITRGDLIDMKAPDICSKIEAGIAELGFSCRTCVVASFSSKTGVKHGEGLMDVLESFLGLQSKSTCSPTFERGSRRLHSFGITDGA